MAGLAAKNQGGFGIFDKIYNYLNRQNKEEKEQQEKKHREETRLLSGGSIGQLNRQSFQYNTMNPSQRNEEFFKKYQNYQKLDDIQKLNMPFQPSYNRYGAQRPMANPRFVTQNQVILSTKTEEILQRSQLKMVNRPMVNAPAPSSAPQQASSGGEIPLSSSTKEIQEGKPAQTEQKENEQ